MAQKICKPPSRLDKLGVKAGSLVSLEGSSKTFRPGASRSKAEVIAGKTKRDLIFLPWNMKASWLRFENR